MIEGDMETEPAPQCGAERTPLLLFRRLDDHGGETGRGFDGDDTSCCHTTRLRETMQVYHQKGIYFRSRPLLAFSSAHTDRLSWRVRREAMSPVPDIEFRGVAKRYGDVTAVQGIDLAIDRGAFVALLGPSGCGKTTCLRMIAGFEQPSEGQVMIRGDAVAGVPPHRRPVNMVFQHYALFPHFDVSANVAYGLRQVRPRLGRAEIAARVGKALEMVRLSGYGQRRIHELSGGQQQRVALARA